MRNVVAIAQRELMSLFFSPIGYVTVAGFLLITGVIIWINKTFAPGEPATLRAMFTWTPLVLTIIIPAITMRAVSEEYRSGTIETLMTAPVSDLQLVIGKYIASVAFYLVMLAGTLIYLVLMQVYGNPDLGASFSAYLGLVLLGLSFVAFGIFASSLTANQIVAWMLGAIPLLLVGWLSYWVALQMTGWPRTIAQELSVMGRFDEFSRGLVTTDGVAFFLLTAAFWLFLSVKIVESRRWR